MNQEQVYLFVYGTLRKGAGHPMHEVLNAAAEYIGNAEIPGYLYDVAGYPGAVPDAAATATIMGEIYKIQDSDVINRLDKYERCHVDDPNPHEYRREYLVIPVGKVSVGAWIYIYNHDVNSLHRIDSGDYLLDR